MESGSISPVTIVIVVVLIAKQVHSAGPGPLTGRWRGERTSPTQLQPRQPPPTQLQPRQPPPTQLQPRQPPPTQLQPRRPPPTQLQPCQTPLYQPGPVLPPTYNTVMVKSCEYPTVSHGEEAPDYSTYSTTPPPNEMTACQMA